MSERDKMHKLVDTIFDGVDVHEKADAAQELEKLAKEEAAKRWDSPEWGAVCAKFRQHQYGE